MISLYVEWKIKINIRIFKEEVEYFELNEDMILMYVFLLSIFLIFRDLIFLMLLVSDFDGLWY